MANKREKITIFKYGCKAFAEKVKAFAKELNEKNNLSKTAVHDLNCQLQKYIAEAIQAELTPFVLHGDIECEVINRGATSLCYQSIDDESPKRILKVFEPEGFPLTKITPYSDITHGAEFSYNWIDCDKADAAQELAFLKRFVRFILQSELITTLQSNANKEFRNLFIVPELALTSAGFVFVTPQFFGNTLKEHFQGYAKSTDIERTVGDSVKSVRQAAEYVRDVCHKKSIYHGDIKPSNFFDIIDGDKHLTKNIDFDTLVDFGNNSDGYKNWDVAATTPLFYYANTDRIKRDQTFDTLKLYDIRALSRMLMYAIVCIYGEEENLYGVFNGDRDHFDWIDFFFDRSGVGEKLFNDLCLADENGDGNIKLSGLFIFEKIRSLLMRCSEKVRVKIVDIREFIDGALLIEELFKHNRNDFSMPGDIGEDKGYITNGVLRHLNLLYLDNENIRSKRKIAADYHILVGIRPSRDWVRYVIEHNYYKQDEKHYDAIDRHLLPDIQWGKGDDERFEYKFDENDKPVTPSPLAQALDRANGKSLFLTAEGGQGKTTTLRSFWLDFLSGKHNTACLYVDAKMLNAKNECNAIHLYVADNREGYNLTLEGAEYDVLLLLDGTNESDARLRKKGQAQYCSIVSEIKILIGQGYQVVVGSRSDFITTIEKNKQEENNGEKEARHEDEFEQEGMQYITACKLRDRQIEHCLKGVFAEVEDKRPMIDLLRNNMMLHIFRQLMADGYNINSSDMKAGRLLDKYFSQCFKARYFKSVCGLAADERQICELIEKASGKDYDCNIPEEYEIHLKLDGYNGIVNYLTTNSYDSSFKVDKLGEDNRAYAVWCELSILKKAEDGEYIWANEIYQEYFRALRLSRACENHLQSNCYNKEWFLLWIDVSFSVFLSDLLSDKLSNVYQFAADILQWDSAKFDALIFIDNNRTTEYQDEDDTIITSNDIITTLAVLSNCRIPYGIKKIRKQAIRPCSQSLKSITIPNSVTSIGDHAFYCCWGLTSVTIPDRESISDLHPTISY